MNSGGGSKAGVGGGLDEKHDPNCTTCTDFKDWFNKQNNTSNSAQKLPPTKSVESPSSKKPPQQSQKSNKVDDQNTTIKQNSNKNNNSDSSSKTTTTTTVVNSEYYDECPMFRDQFGRAAWSYLHTMAAHYPPKPTDYQKTKMSDFIQTFSLFFPCKHCASDFREEIVKSPPRVDNNVELSKWFCEQHNIVNAKLGKDQFDCDRVLERWKLGESKNPKCF